MARKPDDTNGPAVPPQATPLKTANQFWAEACVRHNEIELQRDDLPDAERRQVERLLESQHGIAAGTLKVRRSWRGLADPWSIVAEAQTGRLTVLPDMRTDSPAFAEESMKKAQTTLTDHGDYLTEWQRDALERWIEKCRWAAAGGYDAAPK